MTEPAPIAAVGAADIDAAARVVAPYAVRTPLLSFPVLNERVGTKVFLKPEMLQRTGSFKFRGAFNKLASIPQHERSGGVVAFSSGNHAQGVAAAAQILNMQATIVMPKDSPLTKRERTKGYGAEVVLYDRDKEDREAIANGIASKRGATLVRPYDDPFVIAGQGTAALELLQELPGLDAVVAPVGGGGLLSGTAIAARSLRLSLRVFGAEPKGADDAQRSLAAGHIIAQDNPRTIADGLRTSLGDKTFAVISRLVEGIGTASEEAIVAAMRLTWEKLRIVIEPSSAVPLACLMERSLDLAGLKVGVIVSGGNVDLERLPWQR